MKLEVYNIKGHKTGQEIDLPEDLFGVEPNEHTVYLAVKQYLANQRQGTHKSKRAFGKSISTEEGFQTKGHRWSKGRYEISISKRWCKSIWTKTERLLLQAEQKS